MGLTFPSMSQLQPPANQTKLGQQWLQERQMPQQIHREWRIHVRMTVTQPISQNIEEFSSLPEILLNGFGFLYFRT